MNILAAALNTPVSVMETAGEGGAWGMALLASYMVHKKGRRNICRNRMFTFTAW